MRRLDRRLFTLCSAASLLLCVAVCVLWVRSHWRCDLIRVAVGERWPQGAVYSSQGSFALHVRADGGAPLLRLRTGLEPVHILEHVQRSVGDPNWQHLGFGYVHARSRRHWTVAVSGWLVAPSFAIVLAVNWRRRRRPPRDDGWFIKCGQCGYDLCASPARCPECGTGVGVGVGVPRGPAGPPG